jgi:CBS domain-containing protein
MSTVRVILNHKGAEVASIEREATALEAAREMNDRRIGSLVVLEGLKVIGIITERDILRRVVACERNPAGTKVHEVMSAPLACCRLDTTLDECRSVMTEKRIRHLPVVEDDQLKGIVTSGDILAFQIADHQNTIKYLNEYLYSPTKY